MINISKIISTLFHIGYFKWFPGTLGSLFSLIIIVFLKSYLNSFLFILFFIFILLISLKLIETYSKSINKIDSSEIVIDEFLGIYFIIFFLDYYNSLNNYTNLCLIFIFFRFFDIIKPFPANWVEKKFKNSFGVIFDDIIAGIYTVIILFLINAII